MKKIKTIQLLMLLISISTILVTCAKPDPETVGIVQGTIKNATSVPIDGATVEITPGGSSITTGADGKYSFKDLLPKDYQVTAKKDGYITNTQTVTVVVGETKTLDFNLAKVTPTIPTVTTGTIINFDQTTAEITGNLTSAGVGYIQVSAHGFCWSTNAVPTIADEKVELGIKNSLTEFTGSLNGLTANTKYYVRAFATNETGTAYGDVKNFTTLKPLKLATLTTTAISNITRSTASGGGEVITDGGAEVTERGVCWNASGSPTISGSHSINGSGTGIFASELIELTAGTAYKVRAYATNSVGTAYGNEISFNSLAPATIPTVTTAAITNKTQISATGGGNVTAEGGETITARGVCWNTTGNPTILDFTTIDGTGKGSFTSTITGLVAGTTYKVRGLCYQFCWYFIWERNKL